MTSNSSRVFITHSSLDAELARAVVDALQLGLNLSADRVFCSSIEGIGIPAGSDFTGYLQEQLASTELMVPLITPAYLDSTYCKWELGATWVREVQTFPLVFLEDARFGELDGPLRKMQLARFTSTGLNELAQAVAVRTGTTVGPTWESRRNHLEAQYREMRARLERGWASTPLAKVRRQARHGQGARQLHVSLHRLRDAAFVQMYHSDTRGHISEFLSLLHQSAVALGRFFSTTTGVSCRIAIKQILVPEGDDRLYVQDLTRSVNRIAYSTVDLIEENTDFNDLLEGTEENYFFCNDLDQLASDGKYINSHAIPGQPLPYSSTIVWPIRKTLENPATAAHVGAVTEWQDLVGFLCVDSREMGVFDEDDIQVGAGVADTLYIVLRPYLGSQEEDLSSFAG